VAPVRRAWPRYMVEWQAQPRRPCCRPGATSLKELTARLSRTPRRRDFTLTLFLSIDSVG